MGIYTLRAHRLDRIQEVKGRFWIIAQMRSYEFEWTSYESHSDPRPEVLRKEYRIPYVYKENPDGTYEAQITGNEKITLTEEQADFVENVIEKYLLYSMEVNRERFLTDV